MSTITVVLMIIFVFTFTPLLLVEFARAKSVASLEDFFLQERAMPLMLTFFTVYATWVSSFAFIGSTASFFSNGPLYMTCFAWNILFGLMFMVIGKRLWFLGKKHGHITPTDFFNHIFNLPILNVIVTGVIGIFTLPYLMIQLYGGAYIIETVSAGMIPWRAAGLVFYLVIIIYLWAGGIRALAMTDVFYGLITFTTMIVAGIVFINMTGGVESAFQMIAQNDSNAVILGTGLSNNSPFVWLCMFIIIPIGALMGPPMWIRSYAAKEEKIFNIMPLLLSIVTIMYIGPLLISATTKAIYPDLVAGDNLIAYMVMNNLSLIPATLLLCGVASAALSTANSQIHSLSAVYSIDIYKRYLKPAATERQLINVSKWAIIALSAIAYVMTLQNPGVIIEIGILGMSGTAQIFVPALGALFWSRSNPNAAVLGLSFGILTLTILTFIFNITTIFAAVIAIVINALLFVVFSYILPKDEKTQSRILLNKREFKDR